MDTFEKIAYQEGYQFIAGIDEAGRGPLAGPVVAAAVILPHDYLNPEIKDSKKLSAFKREELYETINKEAVAIGMRIVDAEVIDHYNILYATLQAMREAVLELSTMPDFLLIDGNHRVPITTPQKTIVKGDSLSISIAAASIMAKVNRDRIMEMYHRQFPQYNFQQNKGYGTKEHLDAIRKFGICKIHRKSFHVKICIKQISNSIYKMKDSSKIKTGKEGEKIAAAYLKKNGYRIIETNFRCAIGEIDIIAREKDELVFLEVKTRRSEDLGFPEQAVGIKKQEKNVSTGVMVSSV